MTFLELAEAVLKEEIKPLTAGEIWAIGIKRGYDKQLNSRGKTPWATLGALLYVSSKDNPKSAFSRTSTRPKRFFLKSQIRVIDVSDASLLELEKETVSLLKRSKKIDFSEKDLHKHLATYAYYYLNSYTRTINHAGSTKKEFGEWVHPDMVGCYFPIDDWKQEVYDLSSALGNTSIKLFSFELKRELNFANLRESFFQTVSNSSWANEAYLVAVNISEDEDFRKELSRLSTSFGIGIIQLNIQDVHSSAIICPAQFHEQLDWEAINKLAMNPDFKNFITTVKIDLSSRKVHKSEYDAFEESDKLK